MFTRMRHRSVRTTSVVAAFGLALGGLFIGTSAAYADDTPTEEVVVTEEVSDEETSDTSTSDTSTEPTDSAPAEEVVKEAPPVPSVQQSTSESTEPEGQPESSQTEEQPAPGPANESTETADTDTESTSEDTTEEGDPLPEESEDQGEVPTGPDPGPSQPEEEPELVTCDVLTAGLGYEEPISGGKDGLTNPTTYVAPEGKVVDSLCVFGGPVRGEPGTAVILAIDFASEVTVTSPGGPGGWIGHYQVRLVDAPVASEPTGTIEANKVGDEIEVSMEVSYILTSGSDTTPQNVVLFIDGEATDVVFQLHPGDTKSDVRTYPLSEKDRTFELVWVDGDNKVLDSVTVPGEKPAEPEEPTDPEVPPTDPEVDPEEPGELPSTDDPNAGDNDGTTGDKDIESESSNTSNTSAKADKLAATGNTFDVGASGIGGLAIVLLGIVLAVFGRRVRHQA